MVENESPELSNSDLKDQLAALQRQVFSLLLALIVVSGTVSIYLYRQASLIHKSIESVRQVTKTFDTSRPAMITFVQQLNAYGQTHPEIAQILQKDGFSATPKK